METRVMIFWKYLLTAVVCASLVWSCVQNKKDNDSKPFTNALINETSPYLQQHAHNPVDWHPWSLQAMETAKKQEKLLIISIGYSSCHWCHVMEEESFENDSVAALMNAHFISIKVDREERPDVDQVYMTAAQLINGSGGWPLNIIALPDGKPLYAGTYHTRDQWMDVLVEIYKLYREEPERAKEFSENVARGVSALNLVESPGERFAPGPEILGRAVKAWQSRWDFEWGGNQGQQKFMLPGTLRFLMDYGQLQGDTVTLDYVKLTLEKMAAGGVYDHMGGGFFRYSTDPFWHIPHYEKMLYDNAQLLGLYSRAYVNFKEPLYKRIAGEITQFLDREMKHPGGAYYAALDADTDGEEGAFYTWDLEQLKEVLKDDYQLFSEYYNLKNIEAREDGKFILYQTVNDEEFCKTHAIHLDELSLKRQHWKGSLREKREERKAPRKDDKIITSWNALLISGFVDAYKAFGEDAYLERAETIYKFLTVKNLDAGRLLHSYKQGSRHIAGFLEDYSFMVAAGLDLYEATGRESYLTESEFLTNTADELFHIENSGFYHFREDDELIARIVDTDDDVLPSPNSVMGHNLFRLGHILSRRELTDRARSMMSSMAANVMQAPDIHSRWAELIQFEAFPFYEIAVVGPEADGLKSELFRHYLPNTLILSSRTPSEMPLFKNRYEAGKTIIYVCQDNSCRLPVTSVTAAVKQINFR